MRAAGVPSCAVHRVFSTVRGRLYGVTTLLAVCLAGVAA